MNYHYALNVNGLELQILLGSVMIVRRIVRKAGKSYSDIAAALWNEIEDLE